VKTRIAYSDRYYVDIGSHVFPTAKYKLIKKRLSKDLSVINRIAFVEPAEIGMHDLLRVHTKVYLDKLESGKLSPEEILKLELPFSEELFRGACIFAGGTILATENALSDGFAAHLGGGFHHAFPDHGEGFCVLNDVAVAVKKAIDEKKIKKRLLLIAICTRLTAQLIYFRKKRGFLLFRYTRKIITRFTSRKVRWISGFRTGQRTGNISRISGIPYPG